MSMKHVFSIPQSPSEPAVQETASEEHAQAAPVITPSPAVYVRQVTEQHQNAIARILARVRSRPQEQKENKSE